MRITRIPVLLLAALFLAVISAPASHAQSVQIVKDNGSGLQFHALPVNYVQLLPLHLGSAVIDSGSGYSITEGYLRDSNVPVKELVWTGKLPSGFGSSNPSNDKAASLKVNRLPDVTLRFPNAAKLSGADRADCDVLVTLSSIDIALGASRTDRIGDNTRLQVLLAAGYCSLSVNSPRPSNSVVEPTANKGNNSGACSATRELVTIRVVRHGTDSPVNRSEYPYMLVSFTDLDVPDRTLANSTISQDCWNGKYTEGIEMVSGWAGRAVLAPSTDDIGNTCLVESRMIGSNTQIKGSGTAMNAFIESFSAPHYDYDSLYSGFIAAAEPQGFSFFWTGSYKGSKTSNGCMGTGIGGQPTVAVKAMRTGQGSSQSSLEGRGSYAGAYSGDHLWYNNIHLLNSKHVYSFTPGEGFYVSSLKVDGSVQSLTETERLSGGAYTFPKLNKYPVPHRSIRGSTAVYDAEVSGYYTIEAGFSHLPEYRDTKISDTKETETYSSREITYVIRSEEIWDDAREGTHRITDDMAGGVLHLTGEPQIEVSGGTYTKNRADDGGLDYTFISDEAEGSCPYMVITYRCTVNWDRYFESGEPEITNTCNGSRTTLTPVSDISVVKKVTGRQRDITRRFEFEVALSGLKEGREYTFSREGSFAMGTADNVTTGRMTSGGGGFTADKEGCAVIALKLKHGEGVRICSLPVGCRYRITEAASDHRPSYRLESDQSSPKYLTASGSIESSRAELSTDTETLDKEDGAVRAVFINRRDPAVNTGIMTDNRWITAAVMLTAAGAAALMILAAMRRRKREDMPYE